MKRHSTDLVSIIFGVIFLAIAGWWLLGRYVHLNVPHGGWVLAAALILVGLLGVVGSLRGDRNGDRNGDQSGDRTGELAYVQPVPPSVDTTTTSPADARLAEASTTETTVSDATAARPAGTDPTARDWSPTDWTTGDPSAPAGEPSVETDAPTPGTGDRGY